MNEEIEVLEEQEPHFGIVPDKKPKKKNKTIIVVLIILLLCGATILGVKYGPSLLKKGNKETTNEVEVDVTTYKEYTINSNELEDFDLNFLKVEQKEKNLIYSPLSIKYTLEMLGEGASGESKAQIDNILGSYKATKYSNSKNMSFANALFVRDTYKSSVKEGYINGLKNKYNAELIYDPFKSPANVNKWVSDKTFNLIDNLVDDVSDTEFMVVNALAIDMEWNKFIQATNETYQNYYYVSFNHEDYFDGIDVIMEDYYGTLKFNGNDAQAVEIGATINNYDIVNDLGEDNIRKTITAEYKAWLDEGGCGFDDEELDVDTFVNQFINELNSNYKKVSTSTDFKFYIDDDIKVFEKELKEYDGTRLEYIALMPRKDDLKTYVENSDAKSINDTINKLKTVEVDSFAKGKVYRIVGGIPLFKYSYELNLIDDLKKMGIKDVFESGKADLTGITPDKGVYINQASHKANIEFSNEGIKAAAATSGGGAGAADCGFEHLYEVPVEIIDMTFDKPFMYIIRDTKTKEVWFVGTVYNANKATVSDFGNKYYITETGRYSLKK